LHNNSKYALVQTCARMKTEGSEKEKRKIVKCPCKKCHLRVSCFMDAKWEGEMKSDTCKVTLNFFYIQLSIFFCVKWEFKNYFFLLTWSFVFKGCPFFKRFVWKFCQSKELKGHKLKVWDFSFWNGVFWGILKKQ
jgi:hypothetical protein